MIIVNIIGGLGNQMFQYAFAYAVARKKQTSFRFDISSFEWYGLRKYELNCYYITGELAEPSDINRLKYKQESLFGRIYRRLAKQQTPYASSFYKESNLLFDEAVFDQPGDAYFDGYWQSEKYFQAYRTDLTKHFVLKNPLHSQSQAYQQQITSCQSVSLHIRRGDYVINAKANSIHGTCDLAYYQNAVAHIKGRVSNPHFFIFSDDLAWAKDNLGFIDQLTFIELPADIPDYEEMYLMSLCQHNIIANSSFSWWGAWLNQHPDKIVIAPSCWFKDESIDTRDLIPVSWLRL